MRTKTKINRILKDKDVVEAVHKAGKETNAILVEQAVGMLPISISKMMVKFLESPDKFEEIMTQKNVLY